MKAIWRTSAMSYLEITLHYFPNSKKKSSLIISRFWQNESTSLFLIFQLNKKPGACLFAAQKGPFCDMYCHFLLSINCAKCVTNLGDEEPTT